MIYQNHELIKFAITNTFLTSVILVFGVIFVSLVFVRHIGEPSFLGRNVTDQIRGLAILLVMLGHIGVHTLKQIDNYIVMGDYGVSIFFFLSGFGLARSNLNKKPTLRVFILSRISRVMVPYWIATFIILLLDYFILNHNYNLRDIVLTLLGVNLSIELKHIDYVRWYITVLLIWYALFYLWTKKMPLSKSQYFILCSALILFLESYYWVPIGYAFFSFPFGFFFAVNYDKIREIYLRMGKGIILSISLCMTLFSYLADVNLLQKLSIYIPGVLISLSREIIWVIFSMGIVHFISSLSNYESRFLYIVGKYSYEIFLFHAVFMVKYDIILFRGPLMITFWPYLALILAFCILLNRCMFNRIQIYFNEKVPSV